MGNWNISIEGVGAHHNPDNFTDANRMAKRFVAELMKAGHNISRATFTHGAAEMLGENALGEYRSPAIIYTEDDK